MLRRVKRQTPPYEVAVVIACTSAVFGYQSWLEPMARNRFDLSYAAVPAKLEMAWQTFRDTGLDRNLLRAALPLTTANFLHVDALHIGMNMLFLWVFGNAVSRVAGKVTFAGLYLLAGVVAVLLHARTNPGSEAPMMGASGAIAGLEGAYFVFAYRWDIPSVTVWPLEGPQPPWRLALVALLNFGIDTQALITKPSDNVAYGAHVGGFLGGAILALLVTSVTKPPRPTTE